MKKSRKVRNKGQKKKDPVAQVVQEVIDDNTRKLDRFFEDLHVCAEVHGIRGYVIAAEVGETVSVSSNASLTMALGLTTVLSEHLHHEFSDHWKRTNGEKK